MSIRVREYIYSVLRGGKFHMFWKNNIQEKFDRVDNDSAALRIGNTLSSAMVIKSNWILGIGMDHTTWLAKTELVKDDISEIVGDVVASGLLSELSDTNSTLRVFVNFGVLFGFFYTIIFLRGARKLHSRILGVVFLIALASTPLMFTPFFIYIFSLGLTRNI